MFNIDKYSDVVAIFSRSISPLTINPDTNKSHGASIFQITSCDNSESDNGNENMIVMICYRTCGEFDDRFKCDTKERMIYGDSNEAVGIEYIPQYGIDIMIYVQPANCCNHVYAFVPDTIFQNSRRNR